MIVDDKHPQAAGGRNGFHHFPFVRSREVNVSNMSRHRETSIARLKRGANPGVLLSVLLVSTAPAIVSGDTTETGGWPSLRFEAQQVDYGGYRIDGVRAEVGADGVFALSLERVSDAAGALWSRPESLRGRLEKMNRGDDADLASGTVEFRGLPVQWRFADSSGRRSLCVDADAAAVETLLRAEWPLDGDRWSRSGSVSACARYPSQSFDDAAGLDIDIAGLSFDSPDGSHAGEALGLEISVLLRIADDLDIESRGRIATGQLLLKQFYGDFTNSPLVFELIPEFGGKGLQAIGVRLDDGGPLKADLRYENVGGSDWAVRVGRLDLGFPGAYERYIEPFAAAWMLDGLEVTGRMSWSGSWSAAGLDSGDLDVFDLSVVDVERDRFALTGFSTRLRPGSDDYTSAVRWDGLLLGRINLGGGSASLETEPGTFALASPLVLDVLGGTLRFDNLRYVLPGGEAPASSRSRFEMSAALDGAEMEAFTTALGWPRFSGTFGFHVPRVRLDDGVLKTDGEMRFRVFDGEIVVSDLAAERLFGVLPSLSADIVVKDLDLEQVTETFEFGNIAGRLDGRVSDLRLLDWSPVSFDAWLGTPPNQSRSRSISRRAVSNLTAIGGGSGAAALASPLVRMFSTFSYKRLGLGCRLENYVCHVSGLDDDGQSVLLLEGAGIPKITVRAWNRSVDWPSMVGNLAALGEGESPEIGEPPRNP